MVSYKIRLVEKNDITKIVELLNKVTLNLHQKNINQGKNIGSKIINYAFEFSRNLGKTLYLDCWAGNIKLKNFYSEAGFEYCADFQEEDHMVSVFRYE